LKVQLLSKIFSKRPTFTSEIGQAAMIGTATGTGIDDAWYTAYTQACLHFIAFFLIYQRSY
jgi:hypothetical protein